MRKWVLLPGEHDALDERHDRHVTVHPTTGALDLFGPAAAGWFATTFAEPTPAQTAGWPTIASGDHTLILAPTGSGKTLSAFFWALDQLTTTPPPADRNHRTRLLYIPPLRAWRSTSKRTSVARCSASPPESATPTSPSRSIGAGSTREPRSPP